MPKIAGMETNKVKGFKETTRLIITSCGISLSNCVSYKRANIFSTGKSFTYCHAMFGLINAIKATIFHQNLCFINASLVGLKSNNETNPKIKNTASYFVRKPKTTVNVKYHKYFRSTYFTYRVSW